MNTLELVQQRVGKHIQGLHRRTHKEIVRGLLGWNTVSGTMELLKLNFVFKLINLPPDNVIKHIFLCQIYAIVVSDTVVNRNSITFELWSIILKHEMQTYVMGYLRGSPIISKTLWKQFTKTSIHHQEELLYRNGLQNKGAYRFLRIHNDLEPHVCYELIKSHMNIRKQMLNIVKLCAFPEQSEQCLCNECGLIYTDTVEHYIMRCQRLVDIRADTWDCILDEVTCQTEVMILNLSDERTLDTLLSNNNHIFIEKESHANFICNVAKHISKLMYVI